MSEQNTAQNTHPPVSFGRTGVLLVNLGTPDGTGYWPMRRYLKEFLSDRRVIEVPKLVWWVILNLFILTTRPGKKGKDYAKIWNRKRNESPLKTFTRGQAEKLETALAKTYGDKVSVGWGMRYGNPSTAAAIDELREKGCTRILIFPLYPQYAASTVATACDQAFRKLMSMRWQPTIRVATPYYDHPAYINALAEQVQESVTATGQQFDRLVMSFHGVPKFCLEKGDPYHCHCQKTGRLLREKLGLGAAALTTFQSRFGAAEWLQPYTDKTLESLPAQGVKSVAIVAPGFTSDCLETLEELNMENREIFLHAGGESYHYIPCLNDSERHIALLETLVREQLQGWL